MAKKQQKKSFYHAVRRHVRLAAVPHAGNQYRPHLVRRYGIALILVFVVAAQFMSGQLFSTAVLGDTSPIVPSELLARTNTEREAVGVSSLQLNDKLSRAAYYKGKDMFANQYWAHTSPSGVQPWKWLGDVNYNYGYAGENLAKNFTSSQAVVSAWMASAKHKENMLKPEYQDVGFAIVDGILDGRAASIVVALYATPVASSVQGAQFVTAHDEPLGFVAQLGRGVQSISPTLIGSIILLLFAAFVAATAHVYRNKLPRALQKTWYRHHGAYKALGLLSFVVIILAVYSTGGQI